MRTRSRALLFSDFKTSWYKKWAAALKQDRDHLEGHSLYANKFWQNAAIIQALYERKMLKPGNKGLGFGVGNERLPAVFANNGVYVTATDQDYREDKATHWSKGELATGLQSLNELQISDSKKFEEQVTYAAVNMNKVPKRFAESYDFTWSNCALGHLGSIPAGLKFIEKSVECLRPGGWAVHTTELNVLSNDETVDSGDTVIFRLKDIHNLQKRLARQGYVCSPLGFNLGGVENDFRISMQPKFGNDFSKIQVGGHLATQVILMIHKPRRPSIAKATNRARLERAYKKNLEGIEKFIALTPNLQQLKIDQATTTEKLVINSLKKSHSVAIKQGQEKTVILDYENKSAVNLYSIHGLLKGCFPIMLATTRPKDRKSVFAAKNWIGASKDRPSSTFVSTTKGNCEILDHVKPGQKFGFSVTLATKGLKPGVYTENFSVVHEGAGWVDNSAMQLKIKIS